MGLLGMYFDAQFGSICHEGFTFIQIGSGHTVKGCFLSFLSCFCSVLTKLRDVNRAYLEKSSRYDSYYEAYQKTAETIMVSFFYEFD